jgi:hypothetical protein
MGKDISVTPYHDKHIPSGEVQGDDRELPDRGTSTGVTDTYGADLSVDATNRRGSITNATKSDPPDEDEAGDASPDNDEGK